MMRVYGGKLWQRENAGETPDTLQRGAPFCAGIPENYVFCDGGEGWIRTSVRLRGQIYSLLPLTTRPPLQGAGRRAMWRRPNCVSTRVNAKSCRPRFAPALQLIGMLPASLSWSG